MKFNEPIIVFCIGSKSMFTGELPMTVHGLGLAFLHWLLAKSNTNIQLDSQELISKGSYAYVRGVFQGITVYFVTNITPVNSAGDALRAFYLENGIWIIPENVLVVHDDISVPAFKVNLMSRPMISGGHRGVDHILRVLGSVTPSRIKIGPQSINLQDVLMVESYRPSFIQALQHIQSVLTHLVREHRQAAEILSKTTTVQQWLAHQNFNALLEELNPSWRSILALSPIAIPVIDQKLAKLLVDGVETLCQAVIACQRNHGKNSHVLCDYAPKLYAAASGQSMDLNFFGIDFHSSSVTSDLTWIESNYSSGAPQDDSAFGIELVRLGIEQLGLKSLNTSGLTGLDAIWEYGLKPRLTTNGIVAVVKTGRMDGLDVLLGKYLDDKGIANVVCTANDFLVSDHVYIGESKVDVMVYFGKIPDLEPLPIWHGISKGMVYVFPSVPARLFCHKGILPLFGNPKKHTNLGLSSTLSERLQRFVTYSEYVTPHNVQMLKQLVYSGAKVPIKAVLGGGSRGAFVLEPGWPKSIEVLNDAASAFGGDNPVIMQSFAPKFEIPGTSYEFDIRALVYTNPENGKYVINFSARIYRIGESRLLGVSPIYVIPEQTSIGLTFKCDSCGLLLPQKYEDQQCPKCHTGFVKSV